MIRDTTFGCVEELQCPDGSDLEYGRLGFFAQTCIIRMGRGREDGKHGTQRVKETKVRCVIDYAGGL